MALPSAQLGGLPNMNTPSYIPTVLVEKHPKLWQQALAQMIVQGGGQAAQQGATNLMSRDYAQDPATGFSKLLSGPKLNAAMELDRTRQDREDTRLAAQVAGQIGLHELDSAPGAKDVMAQNENELNRLNASENAIRQSRAGLVEHTMSNETSRKNNQEDQQTRVLLQQLEKSFQAPYQQAQIGNLSASTKNLEAEASARTTANKFQQQALDEMERKRQAALPPTPLTPKQQSVQNRLQNTNKYPDPSMLSLLMGGGASGGNTPAATIPYQGMGGYVAPQSGPITQDQILERITQRANEGTLPGQGAQGATPPPTGASPAQSQVNTNDGSRNFMTDLADFLSRFNVDANGRPLSGSR